MYTNTHTDKDRERERDKERVESRRDIIRNQKKIYIKKHMLHKSVIFIECRLNSWLWYSFSIIAWSVIDIPYYISFRCTT